MGFRHNSHARGQPINGRWVINSRIAQTSTCRPPVTKEHKHIFVHILPEKHTNEDIAASIMQLHKERNAFARWEGGSCLSPEAPKPSRTKIQYDITNADSSFLFTRRKVVANDSTTGYSLECADLPAVSICSSSSCCTAVVVYFDFFRPCVRRKNAVDLPRPASALFLLPPTLAKWMQIIFSGPG